QKEVFNHRTSAKTRYMTEKTRFLGVLLTIKKTRNISRNRLFLNIHVGVFPRKREKKEPGFFGACYFHGSVFLTEASDERTAGAVTSLRTLERPARLTCRSVVEMNKRQKQRSVRP
ncbi:unnamed protein product, partial [Ectocarpus sp. 12 AP-2014]